jgi:hypothetical protein
VNVKLSTEAAPLYEATAQQYRKLKALVNRLDNLSKTILRQQANWRSPSGRIEGKSRVYSDNRGLSDGRRPVAPR